MSMLEQFFPSTDIKDPNRLPIIVALQSNINMKTTATTFTPSSSSGFYTRMALSGAQSAITVADTYVTVADLTGSGILTNCVSPTHTAAFTPTIRITVDGVVYVITTTGDITLAYRLVTGSHTNSASIVPITTASVAGDIVGVGSPRDPGWPSALTGGRPVTTACYLHPPTTLQSYNMPVLRFNKSLKVEMKASLLSGTATDKECGCAYILDI